MRIDVWNYLKTLLIGVIFGQDESAHGLSSSFSSVYMIEIESLDCQNGTLLSRSVCVPEGYLKGEAPDNPTLVKTMMEINNIREVNNKKMRLTLDFYQELQWIDNRIRTSLSAEDTSVLNNYLIDNIWKPDLWIKNLCDFKLQSVLEPTSGLLITSKEMCYSQNCTQKDIKRNTVISYNIEAEATIYCNFKFMNFPMDTQYCDFVMDGSYPYPIIELKFELGQFGITNQNSNVDDFAIEITFKNNQTGMHSTIKLERCILPFIIKYYLPCIAIITVSLINFLISVSSIPARVALLVTQFLTLTNILIAQQVIIRTVFSQIVVFIDHVECTINYVKYNVCLYFRRSHPRQDKLPRLGFTC